MTSAGSHHTLVALLMVAAICAPASSRAQTYAYRVADGNLVGLQLGNFGVLGTAFSSRAPSFEYPLGSGYHHMPIGGLLFGATVPDSGRVGVTAAAFDSYLGGSTSGISEFTPRSTGVTARSRLLSSPYYSPDAVSELDLVAEFDDLTPKRADISFEDHRPLGIRVRQESYSWNYGGAQHVLFLRYTIRNVWSSPLANAWIGLYTELASGNLNAYNQIPPSNWFAKEWLQYEPDFRMVREHYCFRQPVPDSCRLALVPYWAGVQMLTPPDAGAGQKLTLAAWGWDPSAASRDEDAEKYALMSAGTIANLLDPALMPVTGDPCELLALGPFASIAPGDSIVVDFALLGGAEPDSIRETAYLAQAMRDAGFPGDVVPTTASLVSYLASPDRVALRWHVPAAAGAARLVERRTSEETWATRAVLAPDGTELLEYVDDDVEPGARYGYRLGLERATGVEYTPEVWLEVPVATSFALHGARPNPIGRGSGGLLSFSLALPGAARLECFDLLGRRLAKVEWDALGPGEHAIPIEALGRLEAGLYLLRLEQGGEHASGRMLVVQ